MQVILMEKVVNLGNLGDVVKVKDGYARSGVWISVGSPEDWSGITTGANGFYSLSLQTSGQVWLNVRPDVATHLAQANVWRDGMSTSFTRNFTLTTGHLLSLRFTGGGAPVMGNIWTDVQPLLNQSTDDYWFVLDWNDGVQRYQAVLPPDVYYVTARHLPSGYYETTAPFDLRSVDRT